MELKKDLNLRADFPPPSLDEWRREVEASLKGVDFDRAMHTQTYEGITLKPIYTKADSADLPFLGSQPGSPPYLRGNDPQRRLAEGWLIAQSYDNPDLSALNQQLLKDLQLGLTAINIVLQQDDRQGVSLNSIKDFRDLLHGIDLGAAPLFMQLDSDDQQILPLLEQYLLERGHDPGRIRGGVGFDPTGEFARKGYLSWPLDEIWQKMLDNVNLVLAKLPGLRCLSIDGGVYAAAGASATQELAFVLSTAIGYIQGLQISDLGIDQVAPLFQTRLSLGSNLFMEIAKIRAFRLLWAEMVKSFGGAKRSQQIWIHGQTSTFNKSAWDVYVNILRTATEGFAGVIGGADSLELGRFNALTGPADEFTLRLARNQQLILKEEAHFGKVIDPAGGCYYIENLTRELASQAWKLMQELEAEGGMIRSLRKGKIHALIGATAQARIEAVHKRRDVCVGVNMYANPDEDALPAPVIHQAANVIKAVELDAGSLPRRRLLEALEALRSRVGASGANTEVLLINMGSLAEYKARADFATGFLQVGGLQVTSSPGFASVAEAVAFTRSSSAKAFCICSNDDNYRQLVPELCQALPDLIPILAGYPADMVETYKEQGIRVFIHLKADAYSVLGQLAELLEVEK